MKIEVFAICYNEEAMLPYFLRHYSSFCHRITIYDNYSTDDSLRICSQNPIVKVIPYDTGNQIRDDIYLQIKNNCWKGSKSDWVIVGDIDELVYHPNILEVVGKNQATVIVPQMFNMYSEVFPTSEKQIWEEVTKGLPGGPKMNLFRPSEVREMNYDPGCHVAFPEGNIIIWDNSDIKTLHMRFLSKEFVIHKTLLSYQRLSKLNKQMGWGIQYLDSPQEIARKFDEEIKTAHQVL